jgi:hypothetical protein
MQRQCQVCKKILARVCDHCQSRNVAESRTHPGTLNCGNCHRSGMPIGKPQYTLCNECLSKNRREHQRQGQLLPEGGGE